eukprot:571455-Alexandrium_andersonii.AAC.1
MWLAVGSERGRPPGIRTHLRPSGIFPPLGEPTSLQAGWTNFRFAEDGMVENGWVEKGGEWLGGRTFTEPPLG